MFFPLLLTCITISCPKKNHWKTNIILDASEVVGLPQLPGAFSHHPAFHAESAGANQSLGCGRSMISNLDGIANIADGQQNEVASVLHPTKMQESSKVHAGVAFACTFVVHYTIISSTYLFIYIYHFDIVQMTKRIAEICNFPTHRCWELASWKALTISFCQRVELRGSIPPAVRHREVWRKKREIMHHVSLQ